MKIYMNAIMFRQEKTDGGKCYRDNNKLARR